MINTYNCSISTPLERDFTTDLSNMMLVVVADLGRPSAYTFQLIKYATGYNAHQTMCAGVLSQHCKTHNLVVIFHWGVMEILDSVPSASSPQKPDTMSSENNQAVSSSISASGVSSESVPLHQVVPVPVPSETVPPSAIPRLLSVATTSIVVDDASWRSLNLLQSQLSGQYGILTTSPGAVIVLSSCYIGRR